MVEPRKPQNLKKALKRGAIDELAEYDRLLSERFSRDPSVKLSAAEKKAAAARERRLNVLGEQLFQSRKAKQK